MARREARVLLGLRFGAAKGAAPDPRRTRVSGHTECQLASRIRDAPPVEAIAELKDIATRVGAVHTQSIRETLNRYEIVVCHELPQDPLARDPRPTIVLLIGQPNRTAQRAVAE
jgi:hypothetical protein